MSEERIHRVRKENNFVMMDKGFLRNPDLSLKAKGLLSYILSLPDDWVLYAEEITKHHTDGKAAVLSAFKELEQKGHIERKRVRADNGQLKGYKTTVYETPITETRFSEVGKTEVGKTEVGKTEVGKSAPTNNYSTNNDLTNNDLTKRETLSEKLVNHYQNQYGNIPATVVTAMDKFLKEGFEADVIMKAIDLAVDKAKRWDYAAGVLRKLEDEHNVKTLEAYEHLVQKKKQRAGNAPNHQKVPDWLEKDEQEQRIYEKRKTEELMSDVPTDEELMRQLQELRGSREATG